MIPEVPPAVTPPDSKEWTLPRHRSDVTTGLADQSAALDALAGLSGRDRP